MKKKALSVSIVSHGHQRFVELLLADLAALERADIEVILTCNLPEILQVDLALLPFNVHVINNAAPKGFAENHNTAFAASSGENFVILNPDIRIEDDPFDALLSLMLREPGCICAPLIVNRRNEIEDSARRFPTPVFLLKKALAKIFGWPLAPDTVPSRGDVLTPDWVAGMFIVCSRATFEKLHGLSERYHLYYEDVDFCARARLAGHQVLVCKNAKVVHEAQRDSHRKLRFLFWHLQSALLFFMSPAYFQLRLQKLRA